MPIIRVSGPLSTVRYQLRRIAAIVRARKNDGWRAFLDDEVWDYFTEQDDRVCFPPGTLITTLRGERPIEEVQLSDQVLTRKGFKKVVSTISRPYDGRMITIEHEEGVLTSTFNHPIWKVDQGWVSAFQIRVGDFLKTINDKRSRVSGVFQFSLTDSDNIPSISDEKPRFSSIPTLIPMPISTINFQCNPKIGNQKINTVSTNCTLLDIFNLDGIKALAHLLFQQSLALKLTITRKTTELAILIAWYYSKLLSTVSTINIFRWAPTYLTTIMPIQMLFSPKHSSTSFARDILGFGGSTCHTTDSISVRNRSINLKGFTTYWANLFSLFRCRITHHRTKTFPSLDATRNQIERFVALRTNTPLPPTSSLGSFGFHQPTTNGHINQSLSSSHLKVYNLEIEEENEYFANGILVHNCPICEAFGTDTPYSGSEIEWFFPDQLSVNMSDALGRHRYPNVHASTNLYPDLRRDCRCNMFWREPFMTLVNRLALEMVMVQ